MGFNYHVLSSSMSNSRDLDSIPKLAAEVLHYLPGLDLGFWQSFDHKNVSALLGIYQGFANRKIHIPAIPLPQGAHAYK